ncbi:MAG TPA: DUF222 domain-containing protein [Candidatus Dormibacteraeota bacterium]
MALPAAPTVPAAVAALSAAVDAVISDRAARAAGPLGEEIIELRKEINRLEGAVTERLGRFERMRGHVAQGAVSVVAWLRHRCRLSGREAALRASVARSLPAVPGAQDQLVRGEIGLGHAAVIAQAVEDVGAAACDHGDTMLDAARYLDCDRFATVVRHLRHSLDPEGELASARRHHANRYVRVVDRVTHCSIEGRLDAEGGALVRAALEPFSRPIKGDQRSAGARRADALVDLARRQLRGATSAPSAGGVRTHVIVTTTLPTLAGVRGAPAGQLSGGGILPSETVRRMACDAGVTRLDMLDAAVHSHGHERRTIPARLRRQLVARDGGCRFPSCDRPPEWTDAHHIIHWVDGGKTRLNNLVLLCRTHHRFVHEDGWHIGWGDDGGIVVRPP